MRCLSTASVANAKRVPSGEKEERMGRFSDADGWARAEVEVGRPLGGFGVEVDDFLADGILGQRSVRAAPRADFGA